MWLVVVRLGAEDPQKERSKKGKKTEAIPLADVAWQSNNKKVFQKNLNICRLGSRREGKKRKKFVCMLGDDESFAIFDGTSLIRLRICSMLPVWNRLQWKRIMNLRLRCVKIELMIYSFNTLRPRSVGNMVFQSFSPRSDCSITKIYLLQRCFIISELVHEPLE